MLLAQAIAAALCQGDSWRGRGNRDPGPLALTPGGEALFHRIMPDPTVIAATSLGYLKTAGAMGREETVARIAAAASDTELDAVPRTDCLAELITRLRALLKALPVELRGSFDGETWLCFDSAVTGLYGALGALEEMERRQHQSSPSIFARIMVERNDPDPRRGEA